jgi:hypothetical protein
LNFEGDGNVVEERERAEAVLEQPTEIVIQLGLDVRALLAQVAGGGDGKRQRLLHDAGRRRCQRSVRAI